MIDGLAEFLRTKTPPPLYNAQLIYRRSRDWKRTGVIFVHIPKNGGTSVNKALYGKFMGHMSARDIMRWRPKTFERLPSFAIARNPWSRVLSAYRFARSGRAMVDGAQIFRPERYQTPHFESFQRFVLEWLCERDISTEDLVFRAQSDFILSANGRIAVNHLGFLEHDNTYLRFLFETLGHEVDLKPINRTSNSLSYRKEFTPEMRDVVAKVYSKDIDLLGYDF